VGAVTNFNHCWATTTVAHAINRCQLTGQIQQWHPDAAAVAAINPSDAALSLACWHALLLHLGEKHQSAHQQLSCQGSAASAARASSVEATQAARQLHVLGPAQNESQGHVSYLLVSSSIHRRIQQRT
jgi:hypothetical protein